MGLTRQRPVASQDCPPMEELLQELRRLAEGRLCRAEQRRRCRAENGPFADWACSNCTEYLRPETISPWTWHLMFLHRLKKAGYPFRANDLSLETWLLLGLVEEALAIPQGGHGGQQQLG
jgi:hypothetical protein